MLFLVLLTTTDVLFPPVLALYTEIQHFVSMMLSLRHCSKCLITAEIKQTVYPFVEKLVETGCGQLN